MSNDFSVPVVRLGAISKHPNADTLSITEVDGCPVIIRTSDFKEGDLAVYLPIESLIPEDRAWVKEFCSHLKFKRGYHRLKAVRLRQVFSMGMVVPINVLGNTNLALTTWNDKLLHVDLASRLGVEKYEEPEDRVPPPPEPKTLWGRVVSWLRRKLGLKRKAAKRLMPIYDVLHYRKSKHMFIPGEEVVATEKIHGCNTAICYTKGKLWVSSHRVLRKIEDDSLWWRAARQYDLETTLAQNPDHAFYAEVFGPTVQDMGYDIPVAKLGLRFFDILDLKTGEFLSYDKLNDMLHWLGLIPVPEVYRGPYDHEKIMSLADGKSLIASHFKEGIVIRPTTERRHPTGGRCVMKLVGQEYLLRKDGSEKH